MSSIRVDTNKPESWTVEGPMTFASVPEIQERSLAWFASPPEALDLSGVERMDSAGIALVIEWARRAKLAGADMRLVNVPPGMTALAATTGLNRLLNIDSSSS